MSYEVRIIGPDFEKTTMTTADFETAIQEVYWQRTLTSYAVVIRDCADDQRWSFDELKARK